MRTRHKTTALVCGLQVVSVVLGASLGISGTRTPYLLAGAIGVALLGAEGARRLASRRLRGTRPVIPWANLALAGYAAWLMATEAFLWYVDDVSFLRGLMLMLPFLLALGPLVRSGCRLGSSGSALFFATSLAMLTRNGTSRSGGSGFFSSWVS